MNFSKSQIRTIDKLLRNNPLAGYRQSEEKRIVVEGRYAILCKQEIENVNEIKGSDTSYVFPESIYNLLIENLKATNFENTVELKSAVVKKFSANIIKPDAKNITVDIAGNNYSVKYIKEVVSFIGDCRVTVNGKMLLFDNDKFFALLLSSNSTDFCFATLDAFLYSCESQKTEKVKIGSLTQKQISALNKYKNTSKEPVIINHGTIFCNGYSTVKLNDEEMQDAVNVFALNDRDIQLPEFNAEEKFIFNLTINQIKELKDENPNHKKLSTFDFCKLNPDCLTRVNAYILETLCAVCAGEMTIEIDKHKYFAPIKYTSKDASGIIMPIRYQVNAK